WWRSPPNISSDTFDHDVLCKLPSWWGGGWPIQLTRSLQSRTTVVSRHPRMGFPLLRQLSTPTELFVVNLIPQHDPQPNAQLARRRHPRLAHPFLHQLAP